MTRSTKRKASYWIAGFLALIAVGVSLTFLSMAQAESDVERIEINEYQGEKPGSVDKFRENSIRGVQQVDVETYQLVIDGMGV